MAIKQSPNYLKNPQKSFKILKNPIKMFKNSKKKA